MSELWTYPNFESETMPTGFDLTGWDVEAQDGHIGKVDEATYEAGRSYIVVDTGFLDLRQESTDPGRLDPAPRS